MSHWTKVDVKFENLRLLKRAARNCNPDCHFEENTVARGYTNQEADLVLKMPGEYDVIVRQASGFEKGWELQCDLYGGSIERVFGKKLAKLKQEYAKEVVKENAQMQGKSVQEETQEDGTIKMVVVQH